MKLLCVIDSLDSGGAQRQLVGVACGLKARGHHAEFFTYCPDAHFTPQLDQAGISVHFCRKTNRWALAPLLALRRLIRQGAFDAVLAYLSTPSFYAELACLRLPKVRLVVSERNLGCDGRACMRILAHAHKLADVVVANSFAQRNWLVRQFPFLEKRLQTIWNGTDLEEFRPPQDRISNDTLRLLGVARIAPQKNLIRMAEALRYCIQQGLSVSLDWIGRVTDGAYYQRVLRAIADGGVASNWCWLGQRKDIPELMRQYDALILPSLYEGLPNVVCEALASGLPVLASRVSDNARLVPDGIHGFTFAPESPRAIGEAIVQFAHLDQCTRARFGREARAFAIRELSLEACVTAYERLLDAKPAC